MSSHQLRNPFGPRGQFSNRDALDGRLDSSEDPQAFSASSDTDLVTGGADNIRITIRHLAG